MNEEKRKWKTQMYAQKRKDINNHLVDYFSEYMETGLDETDYTPGGTTEEFELFILAKLYFKIKDIYCKQFWETEKIQKAYTIVLQRLISENISTATAKIEDR